jgi:hypothetical protein
MNRLHLLELKFKALRGSVYNTSWVHAKTVEPTKRNKDGLQWIIHRFPIKGGISLHDAMIYDMLIQRNPLLDLVKYD